MNVFHNNAPGANSREDEDFCASPLNDADALDARMKGELPSLPYAPRSIDALTRFAFATSSSMNFRAGMFILYFLAIFVCVLCGWGRFFVSIYEKFAAWESYAAGVVTSCEADNIQINERNPYIIVFEGTSPENGSIFRGESHSFDPISIGTTVEIERIVNSQDVLRVKGTSLARFGSFESQYPFFIVILLMASLGIYLALIRPLVNGITQIGLLQRGTLVLGHIIGTRKTGVRVNNRPEYAIKVRYQTEEGASYEREFKTLRSLEAFTRKQTIPILYSPESPRRFTQLAQLPKGVKLAPNEGFVTNPRGFILAAFFTTLLIAIYAWAFTASARIEHAEFFPPAVAKSTVENE